jgi:hypothetical protein
MTSTGRAGRGSIGAGWIISEDAGKTIRKLLAAASFFIYAAMVLLLHQERVIWFPIEAGGPLLAATSHWRYHTPLGAVDSGLRQYFFGEARPLPAEQVVEGALRGPIVETHDLGIVSDGNGVGAIVAAELAFALFGPHARALLKEDRNPALKTDYKDEFRA